MLPGTERVEAASRFDIDGIQRTLSGFPKLKEDVSRWMHEGSAAGRRPQGGNPGKTGERNG
jgi:hypothetical protein